MSEKQDHQRHEALDRALITFEFVQSTLVNHPHIAANKDLLKLAEDAADIIWEIYQSIGADHIAGKKNG